MKKVILSFLCLILSVGLLGGCSKEKDDRTVVLDEIGLTYTTPEEWKEFEETNIVPLTLTGEYTFAEVLYLYVTAEDLEKVNAGVATFQTVGEPICEIAIAKTESFSDDSHKAIFHYFNENEVVGEQNGYSYYLFSDSKYAPKSLEGVDLENYSKLVSAVPFLKDTIETREFDDTVIQDQIDYFNQYITFDTQTFEGISVESTMFANYDLTMVNFGVAKGYPDTNEFETLNSVNFLASSISSNKIGVFHVLTDSGYEDGLKKAKAAKEKADAKLLALQLDSYLENWIEHNLTEVPSTVFVDSTGKIIGDIIVGPQTYDEYVAAMNERLELLDSQEQ